MSDYKEQEERKRSPTIRSILPRVLQSEFIERRIMSGDRWPESEADMLREAVNAVDSNSIKEVLPRSELYIRWHEINSRTFTDLDLHMVRSFDRFLFTPDETTEHISLYLSLKEILYYFKEERLRALGVSEDLIAEDRAHTRAVEGNSPEGLPALMAILHDVSKYSTRTNEQGQLIQQRNIGIHEATSAVLAGDILRQAFLSQEVIDWLNSKYGDVEMEYGYSAMAERAVQFMETAIASHGYLEFPMKISRDKPIDGVRGAYVYQPVPVMPKEVYLGKYIPLQDRLNGDVANENFQHALRLFEGLREVDMMVGIDPWSYVKYFNEASVQRVFACGSISEYVHSFSPTAVEYLRDAPDVLDLRGMSRFEDVNNKVAVLFTLMHAADVLSEEGFRQMVDQLSGEMGDTESATAFKAICADVLDLHHTFNVFKLLSADERLSDNAKTTAKKSLAKNFAYFVDKLMRFGSYKLQESRIMPAARARLERIQAELEYNELRKGELDNFADSMKGQDNE